MCVFWVFNFFPWVPFYRHIGPQSLYWKHTPEKGKTHKSRIRKWQVCDRVSLPATFENILHKAFHCAYPQSPLPLNLYLERLTLTPPTSRTGRIKATERKGRQQKTPSRQDSSHIKHDVT